MLPEPRRPQRYSSVRMHWLLFFAARRVRTARFASSKYYCVQQASSRAPREHRSLLSEFTDPPRPAEVACENSSPYGIPLPSTVDCGLASAYHHFFSESGARKLSPLTISGTTRIAPTTLTRSSSPTMGLPTQNRRSRHPRRLVQT